MDGQRHRWPSPGFAERWAIAAVALVAFLISASPLAGPENLVPATLDQFVVRTLMGAIVAGALLAPLVLDRPDTPHRILGSPIMVVLGRWSYGLFIWHLAAMVMVFLMVGTFMFNGDIVVVLVLTLVLGYAMAAVSYALIESPCRNAGGVGKYRRAKLPAAHRRPAGQLGHRRTGLSSHDLVADRGAAGLCLASSSRKWGASTNLTLRGTL